MADIAGRRVAVTGASGKLGRAVVADLLAHDRDVLALDRAEPHAPADPAGRRAEFVSIDLTDYGQVMEALGGHIDEHGGPIDAVVHLAAIPAPGIVTNSATFANNLAATWNVFNAARAHAVHDIVWASSETVLGLPFDVPPPYAPVEEEYPPRPESTYSLVKAPRRGDGGAPLPVGSAVEDDRPAVLERHGTPRLRELPRLRRRPTPASLEPVGIHRR